jgi:hypothetical protein
MQLKTEMKRETVKTVQRMFLGSLVLSIALLSGCGMFGGTQRPCKVIDPDLASGAYSGGCKDGLADGFGEVSGAGSYRGSFLAGKKHGRGIKVMPNGDRYEGEFSDDYRHGQGIYVWGDKTPWAGDRYSGEYLRDRRHGWGVFQWGSGDRYEGPWQDDLRMGLSVMETRRVQAAEATVKAMKVGVIVCVNEKGNLANLRRMRGRIERVADKMVDVRIVEMEGGYASYKGATVTTGDLLTDEAVHWQLCGHN